MNARHLTVSFLLASLAAVGCGSDPENPIDAGGDASVDAKSADAKSDSPADAAPKDATTVDASDAAFVDASEAAAPCNGSTTGQCGAGFYCDAVGCGLGKCKAAPAETSTLGAVCGCDNVTYWNATVAQSHGVSPNTVGECKPGKMCGGFANIKCPAGAKCNLKATSQIACQSSDAAGVCWGLPAQCPIVVVGLQTRQCGAAQCGEPCAIIKQGGVFYDDNTCPQ
ncbi:hypothetical protein BH09MYX1_BH09MYX1_11840 [soil metagenome]